MKPSLCAILTCALAALLMACDSRQGAGRQLSTPAEPAEPASITTAPLAAATDKRFPDAGKYLIDISPGSISIRANQVDELELLDSIAARAGFQVLTADVAWKTVTVDIQQDTLHAALVELIKTYPYQLVYTPDEDTRQEVLTEVVVGGLPAAETADSDDQTATGDKATAGRMDDPADPGEQPSYLQVLRSPHPEVRVAAVEEIEPVGDALYVLTDLIGNDPSPMVRIASIRALEFSEDPLAIQALAGCLNDADLDVLGECITTLEHLGDRNSLVHLQPLLMHYDETVRNTAARAIQTLQ